MMADDKQKRAPRMPKVDCPACAGTAFARTIGKHTLLYRELYYHCRDDRCGHVFVVTMEAVRTIRPSMRPNPVERLPLTNWPAIANDRGANDDPPPDAQAASAMTV